VFLYPSALYPPLNLVLSGERREGGRGKRFASKEGGECCVLCYIFITPEGRRKRRERKGGKREEEGLQTAIVGNQLILPFPLMG